MQFSNELKKQSADGVREKNKASGIYSTLKYCRDKFNFEEIQFLKSKCYDLLKEFSYVEYFEIRDAENLSR